MPNYAEEYAYWYFRLNGFFPIKNFVVHKVADVGNSSECDLLAIRPPNVFEQIGGTNDDWDSELVRSLNFDRTIGVVCEIKTGRYKYRELFPQHKLAYSLGRLGLLVRDRIAVEAQALEKVKRLSIDDHYEVAKVLVANNPSPSDAYIAIDLRNVIQFLHRRVERYPVEKYRDRMFFGSVLFQSVIDAVVLRGDAARSDGP